MYRDSVHSAKYIQAELQRRTRPEGRRLRHSMAVIVGKSLVRVGQRLQEGAAVATPVTGT